MELKERVRVSTHFFLDEFFDFETYKKLSEKELKSMLSMLFILDLEKLRVNIDSPFTINNWWRVKVLKEKIPLKQWRGARNPKCKEFSKTSMHTCMLGGILKAVDFVSCKDSEEIREHIRNNSYLYPTFKRLEKGVSWVHVDSKETGLNYIYEFSK